MCTITPQQSLVIQANIEANYTNAFSITSSDENCVINDNNNSGDNEVTITTTPPKIIPCIRDIKWMIADVSNVIAANEFSCKTMTDGHVKILMKSIDSYGKLVNYLRDKRVKFHAYLPN